MIDSYKILQERGFIYQVTDEPALQARLAQGPVSFYVGFDPTGNSLHIGHLLPVMAMRWLQMGGHRAIALVGGGTAMVGDPSGKTETRPILSSAEILGNAEAIKSQLGRFLDFSDKRATMVNNADWLCALNYIEFLRDIGRHFSVNRMLAAESVKLRLETGLSFLEFNYMLLQAYDYFILCRDHDCEVQLGGQDQWGNIVAGVDLVRRLMQRESWGVTFPLLLKTDGQKFGKTSAGAIWLDAERTSPYHYYQFWRNVDDAEVGRLLAFFTMLPMEEVKRLALLPSPAINRAKEILAFETTLLAHGFNEASNAYLAAGTEFGFADPGNMIPTTSRIMAVSAERVVAELPTYSVEAAQLSAGLWICKLLTDSGLCGSSSEARRLIQGGGCYLHDERMDDEKKTLTQADFIKGPLLLRTGKKNIRRIMVR